MLLGMNLAALSPGGGAVPFSNVMWQGTPWVIESETNPGTTQWTMDHGQIVVSAVTGTVVFQTLIYNPTYLSVTYTNGDYMPHGTYTLNNPNGCEIGIGGNSSQGLLAYGTGTSRTFDFPTAGSPTSIGIFVHVRVTAPGTYGGMQIRLPGWDGSSYWNPQFVSFLQGFNLKAAMRFMDLVAACSNPTSDWADRSLPTDTLFRESGIPWELVFDLANRLGVDPWCNLAPRVTTAYATSWATLAKASLNAGRKPWVETANEVWNTSAGFAGSTAWIQYKDYTRVSATVNPSTGTIYSPAHGRSTGDVILPFATYNTVKKGITGDTASPNSNYFRADRGLECTVQVVDADHFTLTSPTTGSQVTFPPPNNTQYASASVTDIIYVYRDEAGKTANLDANYSQLSLDRWNAIDAVYGNTTSMIAVLGVQNANTNSMVAGRLANAGTKARANYVAGAPYFQGWVIGGAVDVSTGSFQPKVWTTDGAAMTVHVGLYTQGSTPSNAEVMAGTGTGLIAHNSWQAQYSYRVAAPVTITVATPAVVTLDAPAPPAGNTVVFSTTGTLPTGLTAGTTYFVVNPSGNTFQVAATSGGAAIATTAAGSGTHTATVSYGGSSYIPGPAASVVDTTTYTTCWVFLDSNGYPWRVDQPITADGTTHTVAVNDTYANQCARHKISFTESGSGMYPAITYAAANIANIAAAGSSAKFIAYECASSYDDYLSSYPADILTWMRGQTTDATFTDLIGHFLQKLCAIGAAAACWYRDLDMHGVSWKIANSYADTSNPCYLKYAAFAGSVPAYTNVAPGTINAAAIPTAPTLPYVVATLPDPSWTYTILKGNDSNNYDISGGTVRMVSTTGIDFGTATAVDLKILANDGHTDGTFDVNLITGTAWYASTDRYAWNSVADTDPTQINSDKGSVIPRTAGTTYATITSGMWDNGGATSGCVYSGTALAASIDTTAGDFLFAQVVSSPLANGVPAGFQIGASNFVSLRVRSDGSAMYFSVSNGVVQSPINCGPNDSTKRVYWLHYSRADGKIRYGNNSTYVNASGAAGDAPGFTFPAAINQSVLLDKTCRSYGSIRVLNIDLTQTDVMNVVQSLRNLHGI